MSRGFTTVVDHLDVASATVTAVPLTISAWVKMNTLGSAGIQLIVGTSGSNINRFAMFKNATDLASVTVDDGTPNSAVSIAAITDTTSWHLISTTCATATSRVIYLDGVYGGFNNVSKIPTGINAMRIGASFIGTLGHDGLIAHVGLWNAALTAQEHALLYQQTPDLVRPASLVEYWKLTGASPEPSLGTSPHDMVVTNTTVSTDNPLFPATAWIRA